MLGLNKERWKADSRRQEGRSELRAFAFTTGGLLDLAVASTFINVLALAMPLMLLQIYDRIIPNDGQQTLALLVIGVGTALILEAFLRMGRSYVSGWMGARFEHLAGCAALRRLLHTSIVDYERIGAGTHLERFNGLGTLKEFYAGQAIMAACDLPFALLFLAAIAYLAGHLVLVPVALIIAFAAIALWVGKKLKTALESRMLADDRRFSFIIEVLGGVHTVKGLAMEEQMLRRYERLQETCADADYHVAFNSANASSVGALFSQLVLFCVVGYGATFVINGELTVGGLAACTMLAGRSMQPLQRAVGIYTRFQSIQLARERLQQLFDMQPEKPEGLPQLPPVRGEIAVENLSFSYGKNKDGEHMPPIFENINLYVDAGETIGVSGANASGKTTLLYLMMGMLQPTQGRVLVDGNDLSEHESDSIHRHIAYLPQEGVLFNGTILENVTMFREHKVQEAYDVSKLIGLEAVVAHMPQGYETMVGDGAGDKLPRGIKQRIAIARALVEKPRVLLFDEANTAMDGAGDSTLRNLLERLKGRVTMVLVTPRPSLLNLSDRIYDIDGTRIVEREAPAQIGNPFGQVKQQ